MGALLALGTIAAGATVVGMVGVFWLLLKLIFLPIRLALGVVKFVVGLAAAAVGLVAMLALAPVLAVGVGGVLVVGLIVAALAVLLPLIPFVLLGLIVWSFLKRPPAAVA
jgi:hypothetical protein